MQGIKQIRGKWWWQVIGKDHYEHIDELFTEKPIDWELIKTQYHAMLHLVMSIHKGRVKASTVLHKNLRRIRKFNVSASLAHFWKAA